MTAEQIKSNIKEALQAFAKGNLTEKSLELFDKLGYITERRANLNDPTYSEFAYTYICEKKFDVVKAKTSEWKYVDLLFQLSKEEVLKQTSQFDSKQVDRTIIETYLFFAIELSADDYTRTELSLITREVNRLFPMPAMILFKHGKKLTLSIINRRLHKKDESKDVLEKVTQIKDINIASPHRAHIEILFDLSFDELKEKHQFANFVELHNAWQKTLDTKELNKKFFNELANWYFWATQKVVFPDDAEKDKDLRNATGVIRLITRLMFVWFLKEKNLVPDDLFDEKKLKPLLKYSDKNKSTYYKAILQNLFFATLNTEMGNRRFRIKSKDEKQRDGHHFIHNVFRYEDEFVKPKETLEKYFAGIPFLNGGLFECLDAEIENPNNKKDKIRIDGFSDREDNVLKVPDEIFFSAKEKIIDLSIIYGTPKKSKEKVRGLIDILSSYKFTIAENTPIEEEVALDPELLGKVFENLLANYNPETQTTARKQTGSFYTPREIVNYMVDESLIAYLKQQLNDNEKTEVKLRELLSYSENEVQFSLAEKEKLIHAIDTIKIIDPACGSGAFPMGILHKLVHTLHKLDPKNELWKQRQLEKANSIDDAPSREAATETIEEAFENNELDYGRKLYLIENCIYGADIQPIAVQISKLRFFISLIVEQRTNPKKENLGVRPLPNLETKFVAANTLIELEKENANLFTNPEIDKKKEQLKKIRHEYFEARTPKRKENCRIKDKQLRDELADLLINNHDLQPATAKKVAAWNPYDQNASATFFDMEWMFGFKDGFDIVIGNPPYVEAKKLKDISQTLREFYSTYSGTADLYVYFYENGLRLLKEKGTLVFITSNKFIKTSYGENLRKYFTGFRINEIVDFTDVHVFEALVASCILSISKNKIDKNKIKIAFANDTLTDFSGVETFVEQNKFYLSQNGLSEKIWQLENETKLSLKAKIEKDSITLTNKGTVNVYRGVTTGYNPAFIIDDEKRKELLNEDRANNEIIKPLLQGRNIRKWIFNKSDTYLLQTGFDINIKKEYPSILKHLIFFRQALEDRADQGANYWNLRACKYYPEFEKEKIIWGLTSDKWTFAYDNEKNFLPSNGYILTSTVLPIKYLLALLNSRLMEYYFSFIGIMTAGGAYTLKYETVIEFPIKDISSTDQKPFITLVDQIISTKAANPKADTSQLEKQIDEMVYKLYELTEDEIKIIEGKE